MASGSNPRKIIEEERERQGGIVYLLGLGQSGQI